MSAVGLYYLRAGSPPEKEFVIPPRVGRVRSPQAHGLFSKAEGGLALAPVNGGSL